MSLPTPQVLIQKLSPPPIPCMSEWDCIWREGLTEKSQLDEVIQAVPDAV